MTAPTEPALRWSVLTPTAGATVVRLVAPAPGPQTPWATARAATALNRAGARATDRVRALGAGRGAPLLTTQPWQLDGLDLVLEVVAGRDGEGDEVTLEAPPMEALVAALDEERWWDLIDAVCAALEARHGALTEGEALLPDRPTVATVRRHLRRHAGLLVPADVATGAGSDGAVTRLLDRSDLAVVLR